MGFHDIMDFWPYQSYFPDARERGISENYQKSCGLASVASIPPIFGDFQRNSDLARVSSAEFLLRSRRAAERRFDLLRQFRSKFARRKFFATVCELMRTGIVAQLAKASAYALL